MLALESIPEHEQDDEMQVQIIAAVEIVERWRKGDLPIVLDDGMTEVEKRAAELLVTIDFELIQDDPDRHEIECSLRALDESIGVVYHGR